MTDLTDERLREVADDTNEGWEKRKLASLLLALRTNGGEAVAWRYEHQFGLGERWHTYFSEKPLESPNLYRNITPLYASPVSIPQDGTSGVRVKALEWDGNRAETPVGIYYVSRIGADWTVERGHTHAGDFYALKTGRAADFDTALVEGKAIAQLDCETRILAALEPSP